MQQDKIMDEQNHLMHQSPISTIYPFNQDQVANQCQSNQIVSGFTCFDQGLQDRSSEPLKDLSNIYHAKQSAMLNPSIVPQDSYKLLNPISPPLLNRKTQQAQYDSYLEDDMLEAQNENDQRKSNSKRKNKRRIKNIVPKLKENDNCLDSKKNISEMNRYSLTTQASYQTNKQSTHANYYGQEQSKQLLSSTLRRQSQVGTLIDANISQSKVIKYSACLHSQHSNKPFEITQPHNNCQLNNESDANPNLKKSKSLWVQPNVLDLQNVQNQPFSNKIIQLPLPIEQPVVRKDQDEQLIKCKSTNGFENVKIGAHLTEQRVNELNLDNSSRFLIGESVTTSEMSEGVFNLMDQEDLEHSHNNSKNQQECELDFGEDYEIQLLKKHKQLTGQFQPQNSKNCSKLLNEQLEVQVVQQEEHILEDHLKLNGVEQSDRFIAQRKLTSKTLFQIMQSNCQELEIINKHLKISKQNSSTEAPASPSLISSSNVRRLNPSLNERGLLNSRLQETAQIQEASISQSNQISSINSNDTDQVNVSAQIEITDQTVLHDFNSQLRSEIIPSNTPSTPSFAQSQNSIRSTPSTGTASLKQYHNIFGGLNSYDQVITQIGQNIENTTTLLRETTNVDPQLNLNIETNQNQQTQQVRNYAQEEKDDELTKNISNYQNLLEQQLLIDPKNPKQSVDSTPSSNILMGNLSHHDNCIPKNKFQMNSKSVPNNNGPDTQTQSKLNSKNQTQKSILGGRVLKFSQKDDSSRYPIIGKQTFKYDNLVNSEDMLMNNAMEAIGEQSKPRRIASNPYRILDAPGLQDDFYLNLVDWSAQNILAVSLESSVYVWNATTSTVQELCDLGDEDQITSLSWSQSGNHLSVGTKTGEVQIWDINYKRKIRSLQGHSARVSSLAWNNVTPSVVASGSKDKSILVRDLRAQGRSYMKLTEHRQEVCGLRWSLHDENQLASGGNDNKLFIWSATSDKPLEKFSDHQAAVKAINWSPLHRGLLATGGGTADQCIRFWNTINLSQLSCINTGSQVCNLVFSKTNDELVSTHGYSLNQVIVWKYPTMEKIATLTGHTFRVLYLAMNPDGSSIVTGAGDETLRFWNIFPKARSTKCGPLGSAGVIGSGNSSLFPCSSDFR